MAASAVVPPNHHKASPKREMPAWRIPAAVLVALLVVGGALAAFFLTRHRSADVAQPHPATASTPSTQAGPAVPVVLVGADCAVLGAAGVSEQVVRRHGRRYLRVRVVSQVRAERRVEAQRPGLHELQRRNRRHHLVHRPDAELRQWRVRNAPEGWRWAAR